MGDPDTEETDGDRPDGTMRQRAGESGLKLWLLMHADRWAVTAALLSSFFLAFVVMGVLDPVPLRTAIGASDPVETLFQAMVTAIITGVTLVVTINQLVLSQELGPAGDQRQRMEGALAFREDVETELDAPTSPPDPASFLRELIAAAREHAGRVGEAVDGADGGAGARAGAYADRLRHDAASAERRLADAEFGTFDVLAGALAFEYSWRIYEARRLLNEGESLPESATGALSDLLEVLELFGPAREHVKTLYFQWELINLSRAILYAAVPALVVAGGMVLYLDDPGTVVGATLGVDNLVLVVAGAATVALSPFSILVSFVVRIATVAKRTLAIGPFVLRDVDGGGDGERTGGDR